MRARWHFSLRACSSLVWLAVLAGCVGPEPRAAEDLLEDAAQESVDAGAPEPSEAGELTSLEAGLPGLDCQPGDQKCNGDVPQTCDAQGTWLDGPACTGPAPVCNSGTCGKFRLLGGLVTLGARPASTTIQRSNEGLQSTPRMCTAALCISGGITP